MKCYHCGNLAMKVVAEKHCNRSTTNKVCIRDWKCPGCGALSLEMLPCSTKCKAKPR